MESSLFSFNNIDRMEVLRGPQGTLFRRNADGRVIQIHHRTPQQMPEMEGTVVTAVTSVAWTFYGTSGITPNLAADI